VTQDWLGLPDPAAESADAPESEAEQGQPAANSTMEAFVMGFLRRDYGAVSIRSAFESGFYSPRQAMTALVVITLFVPCLANLLVIIKERGLATGAAIVGFILPYAFLVGDLFNRFLVLINF
jgi:ferrous iron transport protein B